MRKSRRIRKDQEGVSPVIATILMVAITVVLAGVLYVMVSGFIDIRDERKPQVTFGTFTSGQSSQDNLTASWAVATISKGGTLFSDYKIVVQMDDTPLTTAQTLKQNSVMSFGSKAKLIVRDLGGEGYVSVGDKFLAYGMESGHSWTFSLIWGNDNSEIQHQSWETN